MAGSTIPAWSARSVDYISKLGSGERARGGSTITQQVAKNLLLGDEYSVTRKIREAFLARRIEIGADQAADPRALPQPDLPRPERLWRAGGGARLFRQGRRRSSTLPKRAYLAILPKAPSNYDPDRHAERALERRNWVLGEMVRNGFITPAQRAAGACAEPLGTVRGGQRQRPQRRRLFHRGGAPPADRALRREGRERARTASMPAACGCAPRYDPRDAAGGRDGAARRPDALRARPRLARSRASSIDVDGDWRGAARAARRSAPAIRTGARRWCCRKRRRRARRSASPTAAPARLPASPPRCRSAAPAAPAFDALRPGTVIAVEREGGELGAALDPRGLGRHGRRGGRDRPRPRHAGRLRRARLPTSTAPPRRSASRARPSSRSSMPPRSTTA